MEAAVPKDGSISNKRLREKLGWSEKTYWSRRNMLVDEGRLQLGRGKGGSVRRVDPERSKDPNREMSYYKDLKQAIQAEFTAEYQEALVDVTAHGGSKYTGGRWTRPDLTLVGVTFGEIIPPYVYLDVHTFEVKRVQDADVTAIHEALRHRVAATHATVVVVVPSKAHQKNEDFERRVGLMSEEAARLGVGLSTWSPRMRPRWNHLIRAPRAEPEPSALDRFLSEQLLEESINRIGEWFKRAEHEEDSPGSE